MDTMTAMHEMMRGLPNGEEQAFAPILGKAVARLGDKTMADVLAILESAGDGGLLETRGIRNVVAETLGAESFTLGTKSDAKISRMLMGTAIGCPFVFIHGGHDNLYSDGMMPMNLIPFDINTVPKDGVEKAMDALAARGIGWMTKMVPRFIELAKRDDFNGREARLRTAGGPGYASPAVIGGHVIRVLHEDGADVGDPVAYAEALERGMMELYGLEEPSAVVFGVFSSPSLYRRWRDAALHGAAHAPDCVTSLSSLYSVFRPMLPYESSGFDERMIRVLESDGTRDYEWGATWLESITPWDGNINMRFRRVRDGWHMNLNAMGMFDTLRPQLFSQDDAPKLLTVLDVIDMIDSIPSLSDAANDIEARHELCITFSADDLLDVLGLLGDGYPMDLAKEMLVVDMDEHGVRDGDLVE